MSGGNILRCTYVARPFDATDAKRDFQTSVAMPFSARTTAEEVVREALRHATTKLEATLEAQPQVMAVMVRHEGRLFRLPIGAKLVDNPEFAAAAATREGALLLLSAPDRVEQNVDQLTKPTRAAPNSSFASRGFTSFVRMPTDAEAQLVSDGRQSTSPLARQASQSEMSRQPSLASVSGPSETFLRHASQALMRARSPSQDTGSTNVPLTIRVIHFSKFGERFEVEVPYMSQDAADDVIRRAAEAVASQAHYAIDRSQPLALFYKKKDGTERVMHGSAPLPLPKSLKTPTAFLAQKPEAAAVTTVAQAPVSPPQRAASPTGSPANDDLLDVRLPASERPSDKALREPCLEQADVLKRTYAALKDDRRRFQQAESARREAEARREDLLRSRADAQARWTECAAVVRDIERLTEQVRWFEAEVEQQATREEELRAKLHRLQSHQRVATAAM